MKKIVKVLSVIIAPIMLVCTLLSGCKKGKYVEIDNSNIMQDIDVPPDQTPAYEQYSRQAIEEYNAVASRHTNDEGDVDQDNPEVVRAANEAAAKLYAYACYNERTLDQYAWFSDKRGGTDLGSLGSADVIKQDYYLRINESEEHCGYRYYYTYKYVESANGGVGWFKDQFEAARLRITVDTDIMYRFQGSKMHIGTPNESLGIDQMVTAEWRTKDDEWGVKDIPMVKQDYIPPEDIAGDLIRQADVYYETGDLPTIHGNINILAENIVKYAMISRDEENNDYLIVMNIDTAVANNDNASVNMLTKENGTDGACKWEPDPNPDPEDTGIAEDTGMKIVFRIWDNGLFRFYRIQERWKGKIVGFEGSADSSIDVFYSYSDKDCDMTANLEVLEKAKKAKGS